MRIASTHTHTHTGLWVRAEDEQKEDERFQRVCKCFCLLVTATGVALHSVLYCMEGKLRHTKCQLEETVRMLYPLILEGDIRKGWRADSVVSAVASQQYGPGCFSGCSTWCGACSPRVRVFLQFLLFPPTVRERANVCCDGVVERGMSRYRKSMGKINAGLTLWVQVWKFAVGGHYLHTLPTPTCGSNRWLFALCIGTHTWKHNLNWNNDCDTGPVVNKLFIFVWFHVKFADPALWEMFLLLALTVFSD